MDNVSCVNSVHSVHNVQMTRPNMEDANVAHPKVGDAHVAPLNRPDGDSPDQNIIIAMSKSTGVARFGPKINGNGNPGPED